MRQGFHAGRSVVFRDARLRPFGRGRFGRQRGAHRPAFGRGVFPAGGDPRAATATVDLPARRSPRCRVAAAGAYGKSEDVAAIPRRRVGGGKPACRQSAIPRLLLQRNGLCRDLGGGSAWRRAVAVRPRQRRGFGRVRRVRFHIHHAMGRARRVFCVSREMAAKVRAFCPGAKASYLPNGVDTHRFAFQENDTPHARPVVGLFGDVKQKKGLELLLAALDFSRFDLRIVGQLREENRKLLHGFLTLRPECLPHVDLHPYTDDEAMLREHYRQADIVCIPSLHEGMSNVMLEAMACGKLCVCSAVGGALDVVRDGDNGFLFEPRSAQSLAQALDKAADCLR
ncbi:glycosyltransferase, partial [Methylogaea oryzae]|uniref:glycosyltransferase n=1 Tax=Methylogaea oryzae TaxID=1295382 RepID=UPI0012E0F29F